MTAKPVTVRVTRRFSASPEKVFDAWLDPAMIGRWMFGPALRDEEILRISVDPRVGGRFSFLVRRDGQELDHVGTYVELDRPWRLVFTWGVNRDSGDTSRVTVEIELVEGGSELTLVHELDPAWAGYAKRTEEGWAKMLGVLADVLAYNGRER